MVMVDAVNWLPTASNGQTVWFGPKDGSFRGAKAVVSKTLLYWLMQ